jgi:hypothetical protein
MIETILNNNLESVIQAFIMGGVVLTTIAGIFIARITSLHNL